MPHPFDVDLRTVWRFRKAGQSELDLTFLDLLDAIEHSGKLTVAARAARISHRHAWNLIGKWSDFFGAPLVTIERGRGTQLSELGAKLLWAGKRAQARLGPELENLAARWTDDQLEYLFRMPDNENSWVVAVITAAGDISVKSKGVTYGCSDGQACGEIL